MTTIRLYATLRDAHGGGVTQLKRVGGPLRALLDDLLAIRPDLRGRVLDDAGCLVAHVTVFIDGRDVRYLAGLDTPVRPDQEVVIFPSMAGGAGGGHEDTKTQRPEKEGALGSTLEGEPQQDRRDEVETLAHAVIGAAIEVHRSLGPGLLEAIYEEALCIEMEFRGIPFVRQHPVALEYRGRLIGQGRLAILVGGRLIVELKAVDTLAPVHSAQVLSYLRMTGRNLGLLINFNVPALRNGGIKRLVI